MEVDIIHEAARIADQERNDRKATDARLRKSTCRTNYTQHDLTDLNRFVPGSEILYNAEKSKEKMNSARPNFYDQYEVR